MTIPSLTDLLERHSATTSDHRPLPSNTQKSRRLKTTKMPPYSLSFFNKDAAIAGESSCSKILKSWRTWVFGLSTSVRWALGLDL